MSKLAMRLAEAVRRFFDEFPQHLWKTGKGPREMLTRSHLFRIVTVCQYAFLQDRGALLFDNRYDVPESVRNHSAFRARMV
jgi:hypothetical protein